MNQTRKSFWSTTIALGLLTTLAACGGDADSAEDVPEGATEVNFILDFIPKGQTSPFYLARDKGYWEECGLQVNVQRGYGSGDTSVRVAEGEAEFGWAGVSAVMNTISQGLPLQEIAMTAHQAPAALLSLDSELEDADSLMGLTGAIDPKTEEASMVRAFAAQNDIDFDKDIDWQFTEDAGLQSVVGGQADFVADWGTNVPEWWSQDLDPNLLWLGVELGLYGNGIISRPDYLAENPEIAKCFVEGATKGYQYVIENGEEGRQEAVAALFEANAEVAALPGAKEFHEANLAMFVSLMLDESVKEHGLGYMVPERVDSSLAFINEYLLEEPLEREEAFKVEDQLLSSGQFMIEDWDAAVASVEEIAGRDNPLFIAHPAP